MNIPSPDKPLILVDGSSYLFRAYHALPKLTNSKNLPTGAILGVLNMLRRLINDHNPSHMAVIFDPKGKTTRHSYYQDYKAHRPPMPQELAVQIKPLHQMIQAMGLPLIIEQGIEADDVIGTLAHQASQQGWFIIISTGDKDLAQLVNDQVTLINTMTQKMLDKAGVQTQFGVRPDQIVDYLALIGDSVDNIKGVPKVGPKTAIKWLKQYHSLANLIEHADEIKGKVGQSLRASVDHLPLNQRLTTIDRTVPFHIGLADLARKPLNPHELKPLLQEFELHSWLKEFQSVDAHSNQNRNQIIQYRTILNLKDWRDYLEQLKQNTLWALDTETTSHDPIKAQLVGLSFAFESGDAVYVPLGHDYLEAPYQLDKQMVLKDLEPLLNNQEQTVIGQNIKYDYKVLAKEGVKIGAKMLDTMLESYLLNPVTRHDLDSMAQVHLGHQTISFNDVAGTGKNQLTFNQIPIEKATPYAAEDADITLQLHHYFWPKIQADSDHHSMLIEVETPLISILAQMELHGVLLDTSLLKQQSLGLKKRIENLKQEIYQFAGEEFNIDSPKQLQTILYTRLKLPILKKTPRGQPSTAEPVLTELALDYPLAQKLLTYRSWVKLKTTYTDKLPQQVNPNTGRVHTSYLQTATSTGRLASNQPNLQNIPVRTKEGRAVRKAFIAPKGYQILSADYSQIELRIMAHISSDPGLLDAFSKGQDVHRATASEVFGTPFEKISHEQRRLAKAINFGLIYGMSAFGLAKQIGITRLSAEHYIYTYFRRYPKVYAYMQNTRNLAKKQGYVATLFGRKINVPDIHSSNKTRQQAAERTAINAPMQGSSADIIKRAMIKVDQWLKQSRLDAVMIMQVHDELVFEVKNECLKIVQTGIKQCMEQAAELSVPLAIDLGVGQNWEQAH